MNNKYSIAMTFCYFKIFSVTKKGRRGERDRKHEVYLLICTSKFMFTWSCADRNINSTSFMLFRSIVNFVWCYTKKMIKKYILSESSIA